MSTILVVDDEKNIRSGLAEAISLEGYDVIEAENGKIAWEKMNSNNVDLLLTDLRMPEMTGEELIRKVRASYPKLPIIVLTGHGTIENAVEIMKYGAIDFYTKPIDPDKLLLVIKKSIKNTQLEEQNRKLTEEIERLKKERKYSKIIGHSASVEKLMDTIRQVAPSRSSVLIEGESGTGKELVADAICSLSDRSEKPFIKVNCASLSPSLLQSELFGHEKGAFTGAVKDTKGRFELADGGTIFLDEIGEIDESTQVMLLRVLENREITRVGGEKTIKVDVRVIAATNKNLKERVKEGKFREDFYYRLAVVEIPVPPLRERKDDIELLSLSFVKQFAEENKKTIDGISLAARKALYNYSWPGNIRELKNCMEAAVVMAKGKTIELDDLSSDVRGAMKDKEKSVVLSLPITLEEAEKKLILETIAFCGGNKSKASKTLEIGRKTLHRKLDEWKMGDADEE
jgi:DNA-binding NtrC family response regulator